jgi:hypothetical protein
MDTQVSCAKVTKTHKPKPLFWYPVEETEEAEELRAFSQIARFLLDYYEKYCKGQCLREED